MISYLLGIEWQKFKKNPIIVFLACAYAITLPLAALFGSKISSMSQKLPVKPDGIFEFPQLWEWMGYFGNWLNFFFLGVMGIYIITTEVQYKTQRQNIINGLKRTEYYKGKTMALVVIALVATLYFIICTMATGFIQASNFGQWSDGALWAIFRFFIMTCGYMFFAGFIGFLVRRSGLAVFGYLTYVMIIEPLFRWGVHGNIIKNNSINYYPMNVVEDLMPNPWYKYSEMLPTESKDYDFLLTHETALFASLIYIALFIALGYFRFIKKDM